MVTQSVVSYWEKPSLTQPSGGFFMLAAAGRRLVDALAPIDPGLEG
jgi:hypothetical protein